MSKWLSRVSSSPRILIQLIDWFCPLFYSISNIFSFVCIAQAEKAPVFCVRDHNCWTLTSVTSSYPWTNDHRLLWSNSFTSALPFKLCILTFFITLKYPVIILMYNVFQTDITIFFLMRHYFFDFSSVYEIHSKLLVGKNLVFLWFAWQQVPILVFCLPADSCISVLIYIFQYIPVVWSRNKSTQNISALSPVG